MKNVPYVVSRPIRIRNKKISIGILQIISDPTRSRSTSRIEMTVKKERKNPLSHQARNLEINQPKSLAKKSLLIKFFIRKQNVNF